MHNADGRGGHVTHGQDHDNGQGRTNSHSRTRSLHSAPHDASHPAPSRANQSPERNNSRHGDQTSGAGHRPQPAEGDESRGRQQAPFASPHGTPGSSRGPSENRAGDSSAPVTRTTYRTSQAEEHSQLLPFIPVHNYGSDSRYQPYIKSSQRAARKIHEIYKSDVMRQEKVLQRENEMRELYPSAFLGKGEPLWWSPASKISTLTRWKDLATENTQAKRAPIEPPTYSNFLETGEEMSPMRELVQTMVAEMIGCSQTKCTPWQAKFLAKIDERPHIFYGGNTKFTMRDA